MQNNAISKNYLVILSELKNKVKQAQIRAHLAVNSELIKLYWEIGKTISEQQKAQGWGSKVIAQLSKDLRSEFPSVKGFSERSLKYMKRLYEEYQDVIIVQQAVAQLPWGHNVILLEKTTSYEERLWYAQQTIENGWSRGVLVMQIETNLYQRQLVTKKITNFKQTLPQNQSDLAEQLIKDPYNFDFLTISDNAHERDIESQLVKHIRKFLLELGAGFAFLGEQYHMEVDNKDYYIDLLFYHTKLHCYVVLELKNTDFKPEYIGKLNFYLSAVDDILKSGNDNKTIGLLLCKSKGKITAEYALRDISKPMGISEFKYLEALPENIKSNLPTIEEIEAEFKDE
jgi:predicted nuclease of restriction endonuclease-like (RecB) superfamily